MGGEWGSHLSAIRVADAITRIAHTDIQKAEGRILLREVALGVPIFEDPIFGDRITTLSSRSCRERAGEPAFSGTTVLPGCKSFVLAGHLQLPEVSFVSDSLAGFEFPSLL